MAASATENKGATFGGMLVAALVVGGVIAIYNGSAKNEPDTTTPDKSEEITFEVVLVPDPRAKEVFVRIFEAGVPVFDDHVTTSLSKTLPFAKGTEATVTAAQTENHVMSCAIYHKERLVAQRSRADKGDVACSYKVK